MTDVFISYASEDRERARALASALETQGWSVWWDRKIIAGQSFDQVIEHELETAKSIVVLWSKNSILSEWVKNEAATAAERDALVPVFIDHVKLPLEFRRKHTADMVGWDGNLSHSGFQALCDGIAATAGIRGTRRSRPPLPSWTAFRWNRRWTLGAITAVALASGVGVYSGLLNFPSSLNQAPVGTQAIEGTWYAEIQYSWGISELERFDFTSDGERLVGTASYGNSPRQIVDGRTSRNRLFFRTNPGERAFQYSGEIGESQIQFTLDNPGEPPTKFVAARTVEAARQLQPRLPTGGTEPTLQNIIAGPYAVDHVKTKVTQLHADIRRCYVAAEYDPVDHASQSFLLRLAPDGTVKETGGVGADQRSVELDRCMDRAFRNVNWGATPGGEDTEIRLGFTALPAWRSR